MTTSTVKLPSRMKIRRQPARPPTPSICAIPQARRPEKAPAMLAALKKKRLSQLSFEAAVPHCDVVGDAREKTACKLETRISTFKEFAGIRMEKLYSPRFRYSKEYPRSQQSMVVLHQGCI